MFLGSEKFFHPPLLPWFGSRMNAARIFIDNLPRVWRTGLFALNAFLALSLFDALIGGGISVALKFEGGYWSSIDQIANNFYQIGFGVACGLMLRAVWRENRSAALILAFLLFGYCEDTAYYFLLPAFSPIFEWTGLPPVFLDLPEEVSGWVGLSSRVLHNLFGTPQMMLNQLHWFGLNVLALAASAWVLCEEYFAKSTWKKW